MKALLYFCLTFIVASAHSKSICELNYKDKRIYLEQESCEFPEGNRVTCTRAYLRSKKDLTKSPIRFREGTDFNSFCLGKKSLKKRELFFENSNKSYLKCPVVAGRLEFVLILEEKKKICKLKI